MSSRQLVEYTILDVESTGERNGKFSGAEITAAKSSDFGSNDKVVFTKSHLGNILTVSSLCKSFCPHTDFASLSHMKSMIAVLTRRPRGNVLFGIRRREILRWVTTSRTQISTKRYSLDIGIYSSLMWCW